MNRHLRIAREQCGLSAKEAGYAMVMTALMLVPLMGFTGFAVDIGAWYSRASDLQRAADAAALSGVVWQPNFARAQAEALETARRNGFEHGVDNIEITVIDEGKSQLRVEIKDTAADMYFASLFLDEVQISRQAVGEYVDPVPLGSPKNHFGTDDLATPSEGFHAAINGFCTPREQGDHRSSRFNNNWTSGGWPTYADLYGDMLCPTPLGPGPNTGSHSNNTTFSINDAFIPNYSYAYYVDIPEVVATSVNLYIRDPNWNPGGPTPDNDNGVGALSITTNVRLRRPDSTPLDDDDNPVFTGCSGGRGSSDGHHAYPSRGTEGTTSLFSGDGSTWDLFCTIPAGLTGRYILEFDTLDGELESKGTNNYAILARTSGGPTECDTRSSATCVSVVAKDWMSIFANRANGTAEFYLAEIGNEHEGKKMRVILFDPGEGSNSLQVINPDGSAVPFTWRTADGSSSGSGSSLAVNGTITPPAGNASNSVFSNRFVELTIDLPADFDSAYSTADRWWRIRYFAGGSVTDRTSWSVDILGDPVRLLE